MRLFLIFMLLLLIHVPAGFAAPLRQIPPAPINPGQTMEGSLDDIQQARQYLFDAPADQPITITMSTTSGDLNAFLSLATFDGDVLATDDDSGGNTDALIQTTITEAGTYVITATRSRTATGGAGSYTLSLNFGTVGSPVEVVPTLPPLAQVGARLQPIVRGNAVRGALTPEARFVLYWFEGRTGQNITVTADTGTSLQPLMVLYNSNFNELVRSAPGTLLSTALPTDGLYFLAVALPNATSTGGNYAVTLGDRDANVAPPRDVQPGETAISYGESVRGTISATVTSFTFQFNGTAGDTVEIAMSRAGGDLDSYLYLLTTGGVIIAQDDNSGGEAGAARISTTLPSTGSYLILATRLNQDAGTTTGSFLLALQSDNQPVVVATTPPLTTNGNVPPNLAGLPAVAIGQAVRGTITDEAVQVAYVLFAEEDDSLIMSLESVDGELDPYLIFLNANQEVLAENDDLVDTENKNSQIRYIVEQTGYYVLVATRFEQDAGVTTGEYTLSVFREGEETFTTQTPNEASSLFIQRLNAETLNPAATAQGTFTPTQPIKAFTFAITGTDVTVDLTALLDDNSNASLILTDDLLQPLTNTDSGVLLGVPIPEPGNYVVLVAPAPGPAITATNGYQLTLATTGEAVVGTTLDATLEPAITEEPAVILPISYGERVTGSISNTSNLQDYQFTGQEGDLIRVRMNALGNLALDPLVELRDAEGSLIEANDDIEAGVQRNAFLQATLPADGTYILRATHYIPEDGTPASEGEYELILEQVDPNAVGVSPFVLPIEPGETVENTINDEQTLVFYSFSASTGDVVTIEVDTLSGDLDAVMYVYAYTSGGDPIELRRNDDSPRGNTFDPLIEDLTLPRSGNYLIAVGRFPGREPATSGEFALTLQIEPAGQ